jgi:hypothetical protein
MAHFDRQIETALRLIQKNGQACTWRQPQRTAEVGQPWKETEGAPLEHNVFIVFLPVTKEMREFVHYLRGNNEVKVGSVLGLMGAVGFNPGANDAVIRDGVTLQINSIDPLAPNGQNILFTIEFNG